MAILEEIYAELRRTQQLYDSANEADDPQLAQRRQELMDSIALLLQQHEETISRQAGSEIRERTLAKLEQGYGPLRQQMRERLTSACSELLREIETALAQTRKHIFRKVEEDVEAVLEAAEAKLRQCVDGASLTEPVRPPPALRELERSSKVLPSEIEARSEATLRLPAEAIQRAEPQPEPLSEEKVYQNEVDLIVEPPFKLPWLMHLYRCLWQMNDLSPVRTSGSIDKGITLELRLSEPKPLQQVLKDVPCVMSVRDPVPQANDSGRHSIYVLLKTCDTVVAGAHGQQ